MATTIGGSRCNYCQSPAEQGHADACPLFLGSAQSMLEWMYGFRLAWEGTFHHSPEIHRHPPSFELGFDIGMSRRDDCFGDMLDEHDLWIQEQYHPKLASGNRVRCFYCQPVGGRHRYGCPTTDPSGVAMEEWQEGYRGGLVCCTIQPGAYYDYSESFHLGYSAGFNQVCNCVRSR